MRDSDPAPPRSQRWALSPWASVPCDGNRVTSQNTAWTRAWPAVGAVSVLTGHCRYRRATSHRVSGDTPRGPSLCARGAAAGLTSTNGSLHRPEVHKRWRSASSPEHGSGLWSGASSFSPVPVDTDGNKALVTGPFPSLSPQTPRVDPRRTSPPCPRMAAPSAPSRKPRVSVRHGTPALTAHLQSPQLWA